MWGILTTIPAPISFLSLSFPLFFPLLTAAHSCERCDFILSAATRRSFGVVRGGKLSFMPRRLSSELHWVFPYLEVARDDERCAKLRELVALHISPLRPLLTAAHSCERCDFIAQSYENS